VLCWDLHDVFVQREKKQVGRLHLPKSRTSEIHSTRVEVFKQKKKEWLLVEKTGLFAAVSNETVQMWNGTEVMPTWRFDKQMVADRPLTERSSYKAPAPEGFRPFCLLFLFFSQKLFCFLFCF